MDRDFLFAEHRTKPRKNRQAMQRRLLFILANIALDLIGTWLCLRYNITLIAAVALAAVPLWFFSMRLAGTEYEYAIEAGDLTLDVLHGNSRRTLFSVSLKNVSAVLPDTPEYREKLLRYTPEMTYDARSAPDSPDAYFALFTDADKRRCAFYFDATRKTLSALQKELRSGLVIRESDR